MRLITYLIFLLFLTNRAYAACEGNQLLDQHKARFNSITEISAHSELWKPTLISYHFKQVDIPSTNYKCTKSGKVIHPAFKGYGWLIEIPASASGHVVDIRKSLQRAIKQQKGNLEIVGNNVVDYVAGSEVRIDSSIDFFVKNRKYLTFRGEAKLVVSGPFWANDEFGEKAIGFLKIEDKEVVQRYVNFSARHILCLQEKGTELLDRAWVKGDSKIQDKDALNREMTKRATNECNGAFQVGPVYWERPLLDAVEARPGISGFSVGKGQRNVLMKAKGKSGNRLFVITTISQLSAFDTMALLKSVMKKIDQDSHIIWAVGLQDEEYISGPVIQDGSALHRLNNTDIPTGALLVFR